MNGPDPQAPPPAGLPLVRVRVENKVFVRHDGVRNTVLQGIEFECRSGELVVITGASGCGKTVLLNLIAGLDRDYRGRITLPHADSGVPLSYMFQEDRLLPWRTVAENVRLVLPPSQPPERVAQLLKQMKLSHAANQFPVALSGGMRRRAALARAFAVNAPLMLMDEPFMSLDEHTAVQLRELLQAQLRHTSCGVLFVTHNLREALVLGDRLLVMAQQPTTIVADLPLFADGEERTPQVLAQMYNDIAQRFSGILG